MFDGILLIDKPKDWTSHDVVAKVRGILKKETGKKIKVGHTGTLDPLATGLMILVVGSYCKKAGDFSKLDKTYEASIRLGEISTTADSEGEKTKISDKKPTLKEVEQVLQAFEGEIVQIPPAYSAIKVNGKRAYKLAREGKEVNIEPRKVTIYDIKLTFYEYPEVKFTTKVSSGTYIRTLAEDIGKKLKAGAYLSDLRRIEVGDSSIKDSIDIAKMSADKIKISL
ncbi:MAG TPA: tRNA pseudouridine(55) synthase TruB [Patescibacteria group bacterium]|nr:tRNA pseudouridine(55) synthase TruB [Patescibacteria group bacterium]